MTAPRVQAAARSARRGAAWSAAAVAWALVAVVEAAPPAPAAPTSSPGTAAPAAAPDAQVQEHWYRLFLAGQPCGWTTERTERTAERVVTSTSTEMRVGRMGQAIVIRSSAVFEETVRGEPVKVTITKQSGAAPVRTTWLFGPGGIDVVEEQGGRTAAQRQPLPPAGWLTPAAADEFVRRRIAAGAKEISYVTLDPESGPVPVRVDSVRGGTSQATVLGRSVAVTQWTVRTSQLEKPTVEWLSADGVLVRSTSDLGIGELESRLSGKAEATAAAAPVEVMARTFVPLAQDARALPGSSAAVLRIGARDGNASELPAAGAQRVQRDSPAQLTVTLAANGTSEATTAEQADPRFRRASVMADSDDPGVRALAAAALAKAGAQADAMAKALALRGAVSAHLTRKDLASGFATATEAAASRAGDCTEHAVLLAACLRTAGIPSRVVSGLVYVPGPGPMANTFGWHMWTQAIVDGRWVDLDAVLPPGPRRFDASRLMTGWSAADGGSMDADLVRIVDLMGDLTIDVQSIDGRVPPAAKEAAK
jgi:transglutaminase-like putative cysteine protease